ncbi:MAG: transglutaminase family protein [Chitinophagales bacterium]
MMLQPNEIVALVRLLDDDDRQVLEHVQDKLKSLGPEAIPALEDIWAADLNALQHQRLEAIIHDIQVADIRQELVRWSKGNQDLAYGFYLVSKYYFPEIRFEDLEKKIFKIRQTIWLELNYHQTPIEQIKVFNQVFYSYLGYMGQQIPEDPIKYCLPHIIDKKEGSAVALGLLYQILARDLNLPVYGVRLAKYFVLAFTNTTINMEEPEVGKEGVLFYINPVNRGTLFSHKEISDYLKRMNLNERTKYFQPANNVQLIEELLLYLRDLAMFRQKDTESAELNLLMSVFRLEE